MNKLFFAVSLGLILSACTTARVEVKQALTERGFAALRSYEIGRVLHWIPSEEQLHPVATIDIPTRNFGQADKLRVHFQSGVNFSGGVDLSSDQEASLESEVASQTTTLLTNPSTRGIENVTTAVINDWNARPEIWLNELGISDRGWPVDGSPIYVAVVSEQTLADSLKVQVDKNASATGEAKVPGISGNVKFKLIDTAALEIEGENTPVYYNFSVIRIRNTADGPKFSHVRDSEIREKLVQFFLSSKVR